MSKKWNLETAGPLGPWSPERCEIKVIQPAHAEWILNNMNTHNRPVVNPSVATVEDALNNGTWECNGETIIFGGDPDTNLPRLEDGQNRLWGCVKAGKPMRTWVVFRRICPTAFMTIDRGTNRNVASDLGIMGETDPKALAAVLAMLAAYDEGFRGYSIVHSPRPKTQSLLAILEKHPNVRESVRWGVAHRNKIAAPGRVIGFVHYVSGISGNPKVVAKRDEFFARLVDGANLDENSPILALRNKWYGMQSNPNAKTRIGMGRGVAYVYLWTLVRSWNAFMMGHALGRLQMSFKDEARSIPTDIPDIRSWFRRPSEKTDEADVLPLMNAQA